MLVNNAGVAGYVGRLQDYPAQDYDEVMQVNARGTFLGMQSCVPELQKNGGAIVNIASVTALTGGANVFGYAASLLVQPAEAAMAVFAVIVCWSSCVRSVTAVCAETSPGTSFLSQMP